MASVSALYNRHIHVFDVIKFASMLSTTEYEMSAAHKTMTLLLEF